MMNDSQKSIQMNSHKKFQMSRQRNNVYLNRQILMKNSRIVSRNLSVCQDLLKSSKSSISTTDKFRSTSTRKIEHRTNQSSIYFNRRKQQQKLNDSHICNISAIKNTYRSYRKNAILKRQLLYRQKPSNIGSIQDAHNIVDQQILFTPTNNTVFSDAIQSLESANNRKKTQIFPISDKNSYFKLGFTQQLKHQQNKSQYCKTEQSSQQYTYIPEENILIQPQNRIFLCTLCHQYFNVIEIKSHNNFCIPTVCVTRQLLLMKWSKLVQLLQYMTVDQYTQLYANRYSDEYKLRQCSLFGLVADKMLELISTIDKKPTNLLYHWCRSKINKNFHDTDDKNKRMNQITQIINQIKQDIFNTKQLWHNIVDLWRLINR